MYPIEIVNLFDKLQNIEYVIFKEIDILEEALNGKEDVDIFVNCKDKKIFEKILKEFGFIKRVTNDIDIVFFYGYIQSIDKIVLLHVHYKLLIGSKKFKEIELILPYEVEYINNIKVYKKEIMLIIAIIRSIYRKELKEDEKLLEFYIKNSDKNLFNYYIKNLNLNLNFPEKVDCILKQNLSFKKMIRYYRYIIGIYIRILFLTRKIFRLPQVKFEKGVVVSEKPKNISVFNRLELKKNKLCSYFGAIVIGNKQVSNNIFWKNILENFK